MFSKQRLGSETVVTVLTAGESAGHVELVLDEKGLRQYLNIGSGGVSNEILFVTAEGSLFR
jgi:hypothetical protein